MPDDYDPQSYHVNVPSPNQKIDSMTDAIKALEPALRSKGIALDVKYLSSYAFANVPTTDNREDIQKAVDAYKDLQPHDSRNNDQVGRRSDSVAKDGISTSPLSVPDPLRKAASPDRRSETN